jgi:hypothetical protein
VAALLLEKGLCRTCRHYYLKDRREKLLEVERMGEKTVDNLLAV